MAERKYRNLAKAILQVKNFQIGTYWIPISFKYIINWIFIIGTKIPKSTSNWIQKFLDAGIQDVSTSISIEFKIEYLDELIEMSVDDESDTHVEARDRRYSCLISIRLSKNWKWIWVWNYIRFIEIDWFHENYGLTVVFTVGRPKSTGRSVVKNGPRPAATDRPRTLLLF